MENKNFFEKLAQDINNAAISETEKQIMLKNLAAMSQKKINLMITGATGCGKSSTINAMFNKEVAKVGEGVDPETMSIQKYEYGNLTLWDSPGLGDGKEKDIQHAKNIISKLSELDENGDPLIDLVLVILNGGSRDLGTSYELINNVIIPNLGKEKDKRILVAVNKADMAMSGRHWNSEEHCPEPRLEEFLKEKCESVKRRIYEATGVNVEPIYYSAGFSEDGIQEPSYNLSKLFLYILRHTPNEKRAIYMDNLNKDPKMWEKDDGVEAYQQEIHKSFIESVREGISKGSDIGGNIGSIFGEAGERIGSVVGAVVGGIFGAIGGFLGSIFG
ncbi:MAG: GTPase family protein [Oscillospiraceae bacterium]